MVCTSRSPIFPLPANHFMRHFILGWRQKGHEKRLNACIVNVTCKNHRSQPVQIISPRTGGHPAK